ncbi:MAG: hypothetical protein HQL05_03765 [Nitrospirae bacterium]|nr:hypothetical protein [Nitrospirota bacterium]
MRSFLGSITIGLAEGFNAPLADIKQGGYMHEKLRAEITGQIEGLLDEPVFIDTRQGLFDEKKTA